MRNRFIVVFAFIFLAQLSFSQKKDSLMTYPKYAIGFSPTSLMSIFSGVQISQDFRIANRIGLTLESAYLYDNGLHKNRNVCGIRLRPAIEFVVDRSDNNLYTIGGFYLFRYTKEKFDFSVNNWRDRYREKVPVTRKKIVSAVGMTFMSKSKLSEKFLMDIGFGAGYGTITIRDSVENPNRFRFFEFLGWNSFDRVGKVVFPVLFLNVNVSYVIIP